MRILWSRAYFYPEQTVSRMEFLVMAMRAVGVGSVPTISDTGFYILNDWD